MNKHTGGPAFPGKALKYAPGEVGNQVAIYENSSGMTLRDYFAGKALVALIGFEGKDYNNRGAAGVPVMAKYAYEYADAMIAERAK